MHVQGLALAHSARLRRPAARDPRSSRWRGRRGGLSRAPRVLAELGKVAVALRRDGRGDAARDPRRSARAPIRARAPRTCSRSPPPAAVGPGGVRGSRSWGVAACGDPGFLPRSAPGTLSPQVGFLGGDGAARRDIPLPLFVVGMVLFVVALVTGARVVYGIADLLIGASIGLYAGAGAPRRLRAQRAALTSSGWCSRRPERSSTAIFTLADQGHGPPASWTWVVVARRRSVALVGYGPVRR